MTATTATGQQNRPDMTFVIVIHQSLLVDAGRLAAAVAALGPGDRPGRVAGQLRDGKMPNRAMQKFTAR